MKEGDWTWSYGPNAGVDTEMRERDLIYRVGGLRDQFAAAALTGLCVSDRYVRDKDSTANQALWAYEIADAMLEARKAKP